MDNLSLLMEDASPEDVTTEFLNHSMKSNSVGDSSGCSLATYWYVLITVSRSYFSHKRATAKWAIGWVFSKLKTVYDLFDFTKDERQVIEDYLEVF